MAAKLHRPEPILEHDATPVDRSFSSKQAAERLAAGERLILTDCFTTGQSILAQLRALQPPPPEETSYAERQAFWVNYTAVSERLLAPIVDNELALTTSPHIGFLRQLYKDHTSFVLPFVHVVKLFKAWEQYKNGVHLDVLGYPVFPFYGTYVPTRVSHLELFATWLSAYKGPRELAYDVGTGSGVLALMLVRMGFDKIIATDNNPNAIESVKRQLRRFPSSLPIDARHCDLFGDDTTPAELIVFNPPWTKGPATGPIEASLFFEDGLFERFFDAALEHLTPEGRLVLVFSNVIRLVQPNEPHPIEAELKRGRFVKVQQMNRRVKSSHRKDGRARKTREKVEVWELRKA